MTPDGEIIEAVKQGDRDRFGELVERHQRMVYAIGWSYLGDADLAEDAAQETFLKAFRYLRVLRDPERCAGWLARIARNVSATLRRRRRADLEGRRRWQLEQPLETPHAAEATAERAAAKDQHEALEAAMARLSPAHRESLVLFYLEGRSIREAATMLGVSETAMKTRLHRARLALRSEMEDRIEHSLRNLAPRRDLRASVLALLPAKPLGFAAAGAASLLAKPLAWLGGIFNPGFAFISGSVMLLGQTSLFYWLMSWFGRLEAANLAPGAENDFRKTLLRRNIKIIALMAICTMVVARIAIHYLDFAIYMRILAAFCLFGSWQGARLLRVNRSAFAWGSFITILTFLASNILIGFFDAPFMTFYVGLLLINIMQVYTARDCPRRHDYNLFLRQAKGMLGAQMAPAGAAAPLANPATGPELRAFARFLGGEWLIRNYRLTARGIILDLPPARATVLGMFTLFLPRASRIEIDRDGACRAVLGAADLRGIAATTGGHIETAALTQGVERATHAALGFFLRGDGEAARQFLTPRDEPAIFIKKFSQSRAFVMICTVSIAAGVFAVAMSFVVPALRFRPSDIGRPWHSAPITPAEGRLGVAEWLRSNDALAQSNFSMLWFAPAHPSLAVLGTENAAAYKELVKHRLTPGMDNRSHIISAAARIVGAFYSPEMLYDAVDTPLLSMPELASLGYTTQAMREAIGGLRLGDSDRMLHLRDGQTMLMPENQSHPAIQIEAFSKRLRVLQAFDCLDLVDCDAASQILVSRQVKPGFELPKGYLPIDLAKAQGLFDLGSCDLQETWAALLALKIMGRLAAIDREACIAGILRREGRWGEFADVHPRSNLSDDRAFYAMESLAMLGALDRVKDLAQWQFHPDSVNLRDQAGKLHSHIASGQALRSLGYQERLDHYRAALKDGQPIVADEGKQARLPDL